MDDFFSIKRVFGSLRFYMRTAQVIRRFSFTEWGGMETAVLNTARTLREKGNPSEIFATCAFSTVRDEVRNSIPIHRFPYRHPYFPLSKEKIRTLDRTNGDPSVSGLRSALCKGEFDIIHTYALGRIGAVVRASARSLRVPYVATLPGGFFDEPLPEEVRRKSNPLKGTIPYGDIFDRLLCRRVDPLKSANGVVCIGENDFQRAKELFPGKPVLFRPGGVDYKWFHEYAGTDFRKQAGIRSDRKILLCVSRIDYRKNQLVLPEILALLGEPWHLVLIGAQAEKWYTEKLRGKIRLMNLADRVTMLNGVQPDSSLLPAAYHAASAFLIPSIREPFGITVLEAWSAGTPVVAAPSDGLKKLVRDGETGFFAPAEGAPHEWADIIRKLDEDAGLRERIAAAADEEVRESYSWDVMTDKLLDFYQEVQRIFRRR